MSEPIEKENHDDSTEKEEVVENADIHFEPIISLPKVDVKTLEEEEETIFKVRAKLFRYDKPSSQWKERGTGEVKLLEHKQKHLIRLLMRRDKTLKICANHYLNDTMKLEPNVGSDRSWVWSVAADFADNEAKSEVLAIRFANSENATKFKEKFEFGIKNNMEIEGSPKAPVAERKQSQKKTESNQEDADNEKENNHKEEDKLAEEVEKLKVKTSEKEESITTTSTTGAKVAKSPVKKTSI